LAEDVTEDVIDSVTELADRVLAGRLPCLSSYQSVMNIVEKRKGIQVENVEYSSGSIGESRVAVMGTSSTIFVPFGLVGSVNPAQTSW
jgi:hypothetical protein